MASIGTLTAYLRLDNAQLEAGILKSEAALTRFSAAGGRSLGAIAASAGKLSTVFAGLGIAIGGVALFKNIDRIGTDFEQTMATVGGVMRATSEEFAALSESARKMGETTEWTASQAGESLKYLGMAGFNAGQAVEALPGTLDLATAGNLDLGRAADIATNALTAMQLPISDLSRVNDVFVGTITRSNVNMEEMAEAFKYGAPVAKAFGYSVEELSGMIGTLGNAGIKGSMAGTQLAMAMQKANEIAGKFGYSSSDLLDVLASMAKEGRTNADIMDLFGIRAGRAALVLRDMVGPTKEFQQTLGGVGGEAKKLADTMRGTIGGAEKTLASVFESIKIDVFDVFRDGLKSTIEDLTAWMRSNRDEIVAFAKVIGVAVGGLTTILGGVAGLITDIIGGASKSLASLIGTSTDLSEAWGKSRQAMETQQAKALELADRYDVLTKKTSLTVDEQGELNDIMKDLIANNPNIVTAWDNTGKAIDISTEALRKNIEVQKALQAVQLADQLKKLGEEFAKIGTTGTILGRVDTGPDVIQKRLDTLVEQRKKYEDQMAAMASAGDTSSEAYKAAEYEVTALNKAIDANVASLQTQTEALDKLKPVASAMLPGLTKGTEQWKIAVQSLGEEFANLILEYQQGIQYQNDLQAGAAGTVHTPKIVSGSTLADMKNTSKELLDTQVGLYRDLLGETGRTTSELEALWKEYEDARSQQISTEVDDLRNLGLTADQVVAFINKSLRDLGRERGELFGSGVNRDLIDAQASIYHDMLTRSDLSRKQMLSAWDRYREARTKQIDSEADHLRSIGASAETVSAYVNNAMQEMNDEQKRIFAQQGNWLRDMFTGLAGDLRSIMNDLFFDTIAGDFKKLTDYLEALWSAFLRRMADKATDEFMNLIGLGEKKSGDTSDIIGKIGSAVAGYIKGGKGDNVDAGLDMSQGIPMFATGGIVRSPTLAQIGEVPEAVIPLPKLRDENFMRSLGANVSNKGDSGNVYVTFHVQTPDLPSFKASQQQLITQAAVAMRQARRNM